MKTCSVEGCDSPFYCKDYCTRHYQRWRTYGDPLHEPTPALCRVDDCDRVARARGWCRAHYDRWRDHGDPLYAPSLRETPQESYRAPKPEPPGNVVMLHGVPYTAGDVYALLSMAQRTDGLRLTCERLEAENRRLARELNRLRYGLVALDAPERSE